MDNVFLKYAISVLMQRVYSQRNCLSNQHAKPLLTQKATAYRRRKGNSVNSNIYDRYFKGTRRGLGRSITVICHSDAVRVCLPNDKLCSGEPNPELFH